MPDASDRIVPSASTARTLSIVMPVHNEAECLERTHERTTAVGAALASREMGYRIVFVNDGSTDGSDTVLDDLAARDPHVVVVHLTRNFGHQAAVCAGIAIADGDVVAVMDADLQDPPEVLPKLIDRWEQGFQVVYAVRQGRKEWFGKRLAYWAFYRLLRAISDIEMPVDSGDFCLMDRSAVDLLLSLPERQRFVRGLRTWIGLRQTGVTYERSARGAGTSSYDLRSLWKLAVDGWLSFSSTPLRLATRLAGLTILASILLGAWIFLAALVLHRTPPGWASLACLVLLMSSIQLFAMGVIGEYLIRIFLEVKERPTYLIARISASSSPPPDRGAAAGRTEEDAPAHAAEHRP